MQTILTLFVLCAAGSTLAAASVKPKVDSSGIDDKAHNLLPCAKMNFTKVANHTLPYCMEFYSGPTAIRLPKDTNTTKWGAVKFVGMGSSASFVDRKGADTPFSEDLVPSYLRDYRSASKSISQMVFKATFNAQGDIISIKAVLLIHQVSFNSKHKNRRQKVYFGV